MAINEVSDSSIITGQAGSYVLNAFVFRDLLDPKFFETCGN
jgi:hypothetical protein